MTENERLTHSRASGIKTGYWSPSTKAELVERLAAYEDTGLEPQEVQALADDSRRSDEHNILISMRADLNRLAARAHSHLDAKYTGQEGCRDRLVDLACEVTSIAQVYGVDSVLPPSRAAKEATP